MMKGTVNLSLWDPLEKKIAINDSQKYPLNIFFGEGFVLDMEYNK